VSRRRAWVVSAEDLALGEAAEVLPPDAFLAGTAGPAGTEPTVLNLVDGTRYLSQGYYVSLIAEARGHRVLPSIDTLAAFGSVPDLLRILEEAGVPTCRDAASLVGGVGAEREVVAVLGEIEDPALQRIAGLVHRRFPTPALCLRFVRPATEWQLFDLRPVAAEELDAAARTRLQRAIAAGRHDAAQPVSDAARATLAVLWDAKDPFKPSDEGALHRLERVGARLGLTVRRIGLHDLDRVAEHDALFIRVLTGPDLPSFSFARRAEALGIPVLDDPSSILRCGNKVFLAELLERAGVATPDTRLVHAETRFDEVAEDLGVPFVVKVPDGSFSRAVFKITTAAEWADRIPSLLGAAPLLVAQRFTPTPFDWRVGVLGGRALFAARYWMVPGHWQIRKTGADETRRARDGRVEAVPVERVPAAVKRLAIRAAERVGDGLYGVDLKETPLGPVVIEVNDNPDLSRDYEDRAEGDRVYEALAEWFLRRIAADAPFAARAPSTPRARREYRAYEVVGMEVEVALVEAGSLDVAARAEEVLAALGGRPTSEVALGPFAFSNEFFDHLVELKTTAPLADLTEVEAHLSAGFERLHAVLAPRGLRALPTSMHPWFDPTTARRWRRSGRAIYETYARLFDTQTHGWANVQSCQVNLPFGREHEAVAMLNAAALLVPYLPALAASSPVVDGALGPVVDNRLAHLLTHQTRLPETQGETVPEYTTGFAAYRRDVLRPIYRAVDRLPDARSIRHEWLNARGAVLKFSRRSMELRVLDAQECPKLDVAIAAFVRGALHGLSADLLRGRLALPAHPLLVEDLHACIEHGSRARVRAPHVAGIARDDEGRAAVADVLEGWLARAERHLRKAERPYLELVDRIRREGSLSERIRDRLRGAPDLRQELRVVYGELADALANNRPWPGRALRA
jgi:glutathione synthase/RimK-type ligase-like ATP-grasp enzyme/gamma-glutamyl:cysteine ligase YbdK (ATP-grasp superfamily)